MRFYLLVISIIILVSCQKKDGGNITIHNTQNNYDSLTTNDVNLKFKNWLNDTLPFMNKWVNQSEAYITKKEYFIRKDSLTLTTAKHYYLTSINHNSNEIRPNVIDLLFEYNELPLSKYTLSYVDKMFYFVTGSNNKFDYTNSIENVELYADGKTVKYKILRGRLMSKTYFIQNDDGSQRQIVINFNWVDGKLKKDIAM